MRGQVLSLGVLGCFLCVGIGGCQPSAAPQGGPLTAGPYPESRSIIEWIRIQTDDPEACVLIWGPRHEQKIEGASKENTPISIEINYQATIGNVNDGHWKQTLRVTGRHIQEESPRVKE